MLGNSLYHARKKRGLSQENVAEKLGVSRQTVSKWETNETLPDIRQAKHLAVLYQITLDELINFDADQHNLQQMIDSVSEECPVLATYRERVAVDDYTPQLREMLTRLRAEYGYNETDALLVLKDILARTWKGDC